MTDITSMEPLLPTEKARELTDLVVELSAAASYLSGAIPGRVKESLGNLTRSMNCYYSNLIEDHNTRPLDIERAMNGDYSRDPEKRDLQLEARAHIEVQAMIDHGEDPDIDPSDPEYIRWVHREFCQRLPDSLLWVESPGTSKRVRVVPGEFRECDVEVGRHVPVPYGDIDRFMRRFTEAYSQGRLPTSQYLIAVAAAHHRLLWIHPFVDGNGRVARLVSHAMLLRSNIGSSLWSVSRGLSRNKEQYRQHLAKADHLRQGDMDGRGALSASALHGFVDFFLRVCIDQVKFMTELMRPEELLRRITLYVKDEVDAKRLPKGTLSLLREAYFNGELKRGDAGEITGYQERRGRQIMVELLNLGLLVTTGPRAPISLGFPVNVVDRWLPGLYNV